MINFSEKLQIRSAGFAQPADACISTRERIECPDSHPSEDGFP